jgi:hypothetical protein
VIYIDLGDWDLRAAALSGKTERLMRWVFKNWDEARIKVRELGLAGKNVTRWLMIVDLKNINAITNVNLESFPFHLGVATGYDLHFPGMGDRTLVVNSK